MKPSKFTFLVAASVVSLSLIGGRAISNVSANKTASPQLSTEKSTPKSNQTASQPTSPEAQSQLAVYIDNGIAIKGS